MRYIYSVEGHGLPRHVTTNILEVYKEVDSACNDGLKVTVYDSLSGRDACILRTVQELNDWEAGIHGPKITTTHQSVEELLRNLEPEKPKKDHINPSHYQSYFNSELQCLQWLETMQYLPSFRDPGNFKAAVELQARKYLDRLGGKDAEVTELLKSVWYLKFLAAYIKNGNKPILVKDIEGLLK